MTDKKYDHSYECFSTLKTRLYDVYSTIKCFHGTQESLLKMLNEKIYTDKKYKYVRVYAKGWLMGISEVLSKDIVNNMCYFAYVIDGKVIKAKDLTSKQMQSLGRDPESHFYWNNTEKVYY